MDTLRRAARSAPRRPARSARRATATSSSTGSGVAPGIVFDIINEAEECRLLFLAVRDALEQHAAFRGARTLLAEVGGGSTSLTLLRRGEPTHSGVYALGSIRIRQQLDLQRHSHDVQMTLLRRYISNIIEEIRRRAPAEPDHPRHRGRRRHPVRRSADSRHRRRRRPARDRPRPVPGVLRRGRRSSKRTIWSNGSGCRRPRRRPWRRRCSSTARWSRKPPRASWWSAMRRCAPACCSTSPTRAAARAPRTSSGRCSPAPSRSGSATGSIRAHGRHVAKLAVRLFDELNDEHGLHGPPSAAAAGRGAAPRRRDLRQPARAPQALAVHPRRPRRSSGSPTTRRRSSRTSPAIIGAPCRRPPTCPYVALDREDRLIVDKLAAILRIANALDAEHVQKIRDLRLVLRDTTWMMQLDSTGRLTMERLAATARVGPVRRDVRAAAGDRGGRCYDGPRTGRPARCSSTASCRGSPSTSASSRKRRDPDDAAARAGQVRGDCRLQPRRVLHGPRRRARAGGRRRRRVPRSRRADADGAAAAASGSARTRSSPRSTRSTTNELLPQLAERGIRICRPGQPRTTGSLALAAFFRDSVLPVLTPLGDRRVAAVSAAGVAEPEPGAAAGAGRRARPTAGWRSCRCPPGLPRLVPLADGDGHAFVLLEEIIRTHLPQLFPGQTILESAVIRLSRDAELDLDDEGGRTHLELRRAGDPPAAAAVT